MELVVAFGDFLRMVRKNMMKVVQGGPRSAVRIPTWAKVFELKFRKDKNKEKRPGMARLKLKKGFIFDNDHYSLNEASIYKRSRTRSSHADPLSKNALPKRRLISVFN